MEGSSIDSKGEFTTTRQPGGGKPNLSPPPPGVGAQKQQMTDGAISHAIDKAKEVTS